MKLYELLNEEETDPTTEKQVGKFAKMIEKYLKEPLYRYGGEGYAEEIQGGLGYLFLSKSGPAFRFNRTDGKITSVTVWKRQFDFKPGDFTIDFSGLNFLELGKQLIQHILNPSPGDYPIAVTESMILENEIWGHPYEEEPQQQQPSGKKRQVKPDEFVQIVIDNLGPGQDYSEMSMEEIREIAYNAGVLVPGAVKRTHVEGTKGRNMKFDLTRLNDPSGGGGGMPGDDKHDYYIHIMPQDRETKKFVSPKGMNQVKAMTGQIRNALAGQTQEEKQIDTNELFKRMEGLVRLLAMGSIKSLVIYGGPGTGKTYTVRKMLEESGKEFDRDWFMVKGNITTFELYKALYTHREPDTILVFDDTDSVWDKDDAANILKAALDSYDERILSWFSNRTRPMSKMSKEERENYYKLVDQKILDGELEDPKTRVKFPNQFRYEGRIIFISNLSRDKFDSAVLTRSAKIDMTLKTSQMLDRMDSILDKIGDPDVSLEDKQATMDYLKGEVESGRMKSVSMRSFLNAEALRKSGDPEWQKYLEYL